MSPTARSLKYLRDLGYMVGVVERRIPRINITRDLFGFIDILAIDDTTPGVLAVQTTTMANQAARVTRLRTVSKMNVDRWLMAGNRIVVHGWAKRGPRGKRKTWTLTERAITREWDSAGSPERVRVVAP